MEPFGLFAYIFLVNHLNHHRKQDDKELEFIKQDHKILHCSKGIHFVSFPPFCNACGERVKGYI